MYVYIYQLSPLGEVPQLKTPDLSLVIPSRGSLHSVTNLSVDLGCLSVAVLVLRCVSTCSPPCTCIPALLLNTASFPLLPQVLILTALLDNCWWCSSLNQDLFPGESRLGYSGSIDIPTSLLSLTSLSINLTMQLPTLRRYKKDVCIYNFWCQVFVYANTQLPIV